MTSSRVTGRPATPVKTTFNCRHQFSLDETGTLRLHPGLVPYWETLDKHELNEQPGRVYRVLMDSPSNDSKRTRNRMALP
jgi:hypothetical protein